MGKEQALSQSKQSPMLQVHTCWIGERGVRVWDAGSYAGAEEDLVGSSPGCSGIQWARRGSAVAADRMRMD